MFIPVRRAAVALTIVGFGVLVSTARAQEAPAGAPGAAPAPAPGQGRQGRGGMGRGGMNPMAFQRAFQAVSPTTDQSDKFKTLSDKMRTDLQATRNLQGPERRTKMQEMVTQYQKDVEAILTPDQLTKFRDELKKGMAGGPGQGPGADLMGQLDSLSLTADQKTKVEPIVKDTEDQLTKLRGDQSLDQQARGQKQTQILDDMRAKVRPLLTPDQQTKLDEMRFRAGGGMGGNRGNRRGQNGGGAPAPGGTF